MPPTVDGTKHRPVVEATDCQPVLVGVHGTESLQGRQHQGAPAMVAIGLAAGEENLQRLPCSHLDMLDTQPAQFVAAQRPPKAHQEQRLVPRRTQPHRPLFRAQLQGQAFNARLQLL
ncbi:hypothetical protein D3C72_2213070 [compost metagenome]